METWKKEAVDALAEFKAEGWREWTPKWLESALFVEEEAGGSGPMVMTHNERIAGLEKHFESSVEEAMRKVEEGLVSPEDARKLIAQLREFREANLKKAEDYEQWDLGIVDEEEGEDDDVEIEGKGKGKKREVRKEDKKEVKKTKAPSKKASQALIEESDEEEEDDEEKWEDAPLGWRPDASAKLRRDFISCLCLY